MTAEAADAAGPAPMCFTSFGLRIGVGTTDPDAMVRLSAGLPAAWDRCAPGPVDRLYTLDRDVVGDSHTLTVGSEVVGRAEGLDQALDCLEMDARHFVAEFAPGPVFVHAGTVGVSGRALVIPGRSGTGKSTLVAALVRAGATYYCDEYAVFDDTGRVHPYPKPLALWDPYGSKTATGIGVSRAEHLPPLALGAVVFGGFGGFGGSGTTWQPTTASAGQGLMALVDNTVAVRRQPAKTLRFLARAMADVIVLSGPRGEAGQTAEAVLQRLEGMWD